MRCSSRFLAGLLAAVLFACGPTTGEYLGSPEGGELEVAPSVAVGDDGSVWLAYSAKEAEVAPDRYGGALSRYTPAGGWEPIALWESWFSLARVVVPSDGLLRLVATAAYPSTLGEVRTWRDGAWTDALSFPADAIDAQFLTMHVAQDGTVLAAARRSDSTVSAHRFDGAWQELAGPFENVACVELTTTGAGEPVALRVGRRDATVCRWSTQWSCLPNPQPDAWDVYGLDAAFTVGAGGEWWMATLAEYDAEHESGAWLWRSDDHQTWQQVGTRIDAHGEGVDLALSGAGEVLVVTIEPAEDALAIRRWTGTEWALIARRARVDATARMADPVLAAGANGSIAVAWAEPSEAPVAPSRSQVHLMRIGGPTQ